MNSALSEYIQLQKRRELVALACTINYRPDYNFKKPRAEGEMSQST